MLRNLSTTSDIAMQQAERIGSKILNNFREGFLLAVGEYHTTASIGITLFNSQRYTADELLKQADIAMYQSKTSDCNSLRFFKSIGE